MYLNLEQTTCVYVGEQSWFDLGAKKKTHFHDVYTS